MNRKQRRLAAKKAGKSTGAAPAPAVGEILDLALANHRAGRLDEAVGHLQRALAIEPALAEAHFCLGSALKEQGKLDEAGAAYRCAVIVEPGLARRFTTNVILSV